MLIFLKFIQCTFLFHLQCSIVSKKQVINWQLHSYIYEQNLKMPSVLQNC